MTPPHNLNKVRLCRILNQLGQDNEGTIINAGRLAIQAIKQMGLTWYDLMGIDEKGNDLRPKPDPVNEAPKTSEKTTRARRAETREAPNRKRAERPRSGARRQGNGKPPSDNRFTEPRPKFDGVRVQVADMQELCETEQAWNLSAKDESFLKTVKEWQGPLTRRQYMYLCRLYAWCKKQVEDTAGKKRA